MSDFIKDCLSGKAEYQDIDDYIDLWHEREGEEELYQFLGMTKDEYASFVTDPNTLPKIIAAYNESFPQQHY